jgi:glycosyltransferase involved in cell wall biosynthesis
MRRQSLGAFPPLRHRSSSKLRRNSTLFAPGSDEESLSLCVAAPTIRDTNDTRTALVHDYLNQRGGAERVFRHVADLYPGAPVFTSLFDPGATGDLVAAERVRTSLLQKLPGAGRYFRYLAPLYPAAFEGFDLSAYDLIVSTTTSWAKGVRFRPDATHVCYIHTVSRFAFAYDQYVGGLTSLPIVRPVVDALVAWDREAAKRPTAFIANSHNVAARVKKYYGRDAAVAHCPIDVERFAIGPGGGDYYLVVSRLLPYKRVDLAIEACRLAGARLLIAGAGPAERALKAAAAGSRTEFLGSVSDAELRRVMGDARAVILPGEEDYGLVPLEANASGRPAIAYGRGGALETIRPGVTGEHFAAPLAESLAAALRRFEPARYDPAVLRAHAESFGPEPFKARFAELVAGIVRQNANRS